MAIPSGDHGSLKSPMPNWGMGNIHEITIEEEYGSIFSLHLFLPLGGYYEKLLSQGFTKCIVMIYFFPCAVPMGPSTGIDVVAPGHQDIIPFSGAPTTVWYWPPFAV